MSSSQLLFIQCSLGLEVLLEEEVAPWGRSPQRRSGGVELRVDREGLWRVCLSSRLAEGVRIRFKPFVAADFGSLQTELRKLPFRAYLAQGAHVQVKVSCHESRLWHSGAVEERVAAVLQDHVGWQLGPVPDAFLHTLFVRLEKNEVQVSLDAAGPRLHQRGERTRVELASLRETLAAALVRLARQRLAETSPISSESPVLWDPFCGAGTLPLEWCGAKLGRVPGQRRNFALEHFRDFDAQAFAHFREQWVGEAAKSATAAGSGLLAIASDRSERAVQAARANVADSGYDEQIQVLCGDLAEVAAQVPRGACVVTNPPYGRRLQEAGAVRALLRVLEQRPDLRPVVVLVGGAAQKVVPVNRPALARFKNGGLNVSARLLRG